MRRAMRIMTGSVLFVTLFAGGAVADDERFHWNVTKWGKPGARRIYDLATVETTQGQVMSIDRFPAREGGAPEIHLSLKTATETIDVFLGPEPYVEKQPVKIASNDEVEVKGSRVKLRQRSMLMAAEVRKGQATLALRDANGAALWGKADTTGPSAEETQP